MLSIIRLNEALFVIISPEFVRAGSEVWALNYLKNFGVDERLLTEIFYQLELSDTAEAFKPVRHLEFINNAWIESDLTLERAA